MQEFYLEGEGVVRSLRELSSFPFGKLVEKLFLSLLCKFARSVSLTVQNSRPSGCAQNIECLCRLFIHGTIFRVRRLENEEACSYDCCAAGCFDAFKLFGHHAEFINGSTENGTYSVDVALEGGTGRAKILSPAELVVKDGVLVVTVTWSSKNYDYMIVNDVKYMNLTPGKNSSFSFPIKELGKPIDVIGDSVAMSKPHEIEYKLTFTLSK